MAMAFKDGFLGVFWEVKDYTIKCKFKAVGYKIQGYELDSWSVNGLHIH